MSSGSTLAHHQPPLPPSSNTAAPQLMRLPPSPPGGEPRRWEPKVNLIGMKVQDPMIHCCEECDHPILIYGRMIPCKHVFCLDCAKKTEGSCLRCSDPVSRIERCTLGAVFLCSYGGQKHGKTGCRRTYLSQRDLEAHIKHRHQKSASVSSHKSTADQSLKRGEGHHHAPPPGPITPTVPPPVSSYEQSQPPPATIPVVSSSRSSNLITLTVHDDQRQMDTMPAAPLQLPQEVPVPFYTNYPPPQLHVGHPPPPVPIPPPSSHVSYPPGPPPNMAPIPSQPMVMAYSPNPGAPTMHIPPPNMGAHMFRQELRGTIYAPQSGAGEPPRPLFAHQPGITEQGLVYPNQQPQRSTTPLLQGGPVTSLADQPYYQQR